MSWDDDLYRRLATVVASRRAVGMLGVGICEESDDMLD